jgi:Domain of unknown function (DUF1844)
LVAEKNDKSFVPQAVDLSTLIMGFSTAALHYMGQAPLTGKNTPLPNLDLAKQNIDIINLIQEKTKGNCTIEEDALIRQVLSDLMLRFVEATAEIQKKG